MTGRVVAMLVQSFALLACPAAWAQDPLVAVLHAAGHADGAVADANGYEAIRLNGAPGLMVADPSGGAWRFEASGLEGGRCTGRGELEVLGGHPLLVRVEVSVELTGMDDCVIEGDAIFCPCSVRFESHLYAIDRFTGAIVGSRRVVVQERWPEDARGGRTQVELGGHSARGDFGDLVLGAADPRTKAARQTGERRAHALVASGRELTKRDDLIAAIASFDAAIRADPWTARAWSGRGYARLRAKSDLLIARTDFEVALHLDTSAAFASAVWFNLGSAQLGLDERANARRSFERCAALGNKACVDVLTTL